MANACPEVQRQHRMLVSNNYQFTVEAGLRNSLLALSTPRFWIPCKSQHKQQRPDKIDVTECRLKGQSSCSAYPHGEKGSNRHKPWCKMMKSRIGIHDHTILLCTSAKQDAAGCAAEPLLPKTLQFCMTLLNKYVSGDRYYYKLTLREYLESSWIIIVPPFYWLI